MSQQDEGRPRRDDAQKANHDPGPRTRRARPTGAPAKGRTTQRTAARAGGPTGSPTKERMGARTDAVPADGGAAEALARARAHARSAVSEAILALHALVDAASYATTGEPSSAHPALARLVRPTEAFAVALGGDSTAASPLVGAIAHALDAEIARWEACAHDDPDARAVLRAYLGLREMLWELGVRRTSPAAATAPGPDAGRRAAPRARTTGSAAQRARRRLERVPLG